MIDFWVLLQKSKLLNSWFKAPNCIVEPRVFLSYPLPVTIALSAEPGKSLPEAVSLLNYVFLGHSSMAICRAECTKHSLKLPFYQVLCLAVRIRGTFTERKKIKLTSCFLHTNSLPHCKRQRHLLNGFSKFHAKKQNKTKTTQTHTKITLKSPSVLFIVNDHPNKIILDTIHSCVADTAHFSSWGIFTNSVVLKYGCLPIANVNLSLFLVSCVSGDCDFQILQLDLILVCWEDHFIPSLWFYIPFPDGTSEYM